MQVGAQALERITRAIFEAAGSAPDEASKVAARLVEANLCGHDSHGIIRVLQYVTFIKSGKLVPNQTAEVVRDTGAVAILDGRLGFGQIVAEQAMSFAIDKAKRFGIGMAGLRRASHVGRLADWAIMATDQGQAAVILCNGIGHRMLVAPHGGRDARGSTNPFAIAMPTGDGGEPIVLDFATSAIAEGKVRVASNRGVQVPDDCLLDAEGRPTRDPNVMYTEPFGAMLPFGGALGGHKGGGLWVMCDLLAGALSGGGCSHQPDRADPSFTNNLIAIAIAPELFAEPDGMLAEVRRYGEFIKSSRPRTPEGRVMLPGDPERLSRERRLAEGIPVEDATWEQLMDAGTAVGLEQSELEAIARA